MVLTCLTMVQQPIDRHGYMPFSRWIKDAEFNQIKEYIWAVLMMKMSCTICVNVSPQTLAHQAHLTEDCPYLATGIPERSISAADLMKAIRPKEFPWPEDPAYGGKPRRCKECKLPWNFACHPFKREGDECRGLYKGVVTKAVRMAALLNADVIREVDGAPCPKVDSAHFDEWCMIPLKKDEGPENWFNIDLVFEHCSAFILCRP